MKLSIITCTYNSEKYLQECIDALIAQNLDSSLFEHIFIDGQSTDKTAEIIEGYVNQNPKYNITVVPQKPQGVYAAMNEGIKVSMGEYILFLNSDDYLDPGILTNYLKFVEINQGDIYYGKLRIVNKKKKYIVPENNILLRRLFFRLGFNTLVYHPTTLIKRDLFEELGYYNETKRIASDFGFWLLCLVKGKKFILYPHVVSNFRVHSGSISSHHLELQTQEIATFREQYMGRRGVLIHQISKLYLLYK